jgi:hypothetical protein
VGALHNPTDIADRYPLQLTDNDFVWQYDHKSSRSLNFLIDELFLHIADSQRRPQCW